MPQGRMAEWQESFRIDSLYTDWDDMPATPSVYLIRRRRPVNRVGGTDARGILYIGRSVNLRERLWQFWYANHHTASVYLWCNPTLARGVLGRRCSSHKDVEDALGRLFARIATPVPKRQLEGAERALLYQYVRRYGELPPLNFVLPGKYVRCPGEARLKWADAGLLGV